MIEDDRTSWQTRQNGEKKLFSIPSISTHSNLNSFQASSEQHRRPTTEGKINQETINSRWIWLKTHWKLVSTRAINSFYTASTENIHYHTLSWKRLKSVLSSSSRAYLIFDRWRISKIFKFSFVSMLRLGDCFLTIQICSWCRLESVIKIIREQSRKFEYTRFMSFLYSPRSS